MTNCLFFVVTLYWRRWRKCNKKNEQFNDYILIRLSRTPWGFFHFLYGRMNKQTGQIKVVSYKPDAFEKSGFEPIFRGHVERGD